MFELGFDSDIYESASTYLSPFANTIAQEYRSHSLPPELGLDASLFKLPRTLEVSGYCCFFDENQAMLVVADDDASMMFRSILTP